MCVGIGGGATDFGRPSANSGYAESVAMGLCECKVTDILRGKRAFGDKKLVFHEICQNAPPKCDKVTR